jgi:hypothetical protein
MLEVVVVLLFCAAFAASVISFARNSTATFDEIAHLSAGYAYLRWDDYRLNPEHPPLMKKLAALPLLWRTNWPANVDLRRGEASSSPADSEACLRYAWAISLKHSDAAHYFGHYFLYGIRPGAFPTAETNLPPTAVRLDPQAFYNQGDDRVFWGRMSILLLGLALAVLIFLWAREGFGFWGGTLSLLLFCFDPNFIAHSGLMTTDVGLSLFLFGAVYFLWRSCRRVEVTSVILFLLFFGLAFATKFSALLLLPIFWLTVSGRMISPEPLLIGAVGRVKLGSLASRAAWFAGLFAAALLAAYTSIWASYAFRYSAAKDPEAAAQAEAQILQAQNSASGQSDRAAESREEAGREPGYFPIAATARRSAAIKRLLATSPQGTTSNDDILKTMADVPLGWNEKLILFAQNHHLLPEAYIYGFIHAESISQNRPSFLLGQYSNTGFRSYFLYAFLLKTPLPTLVLIITALVFSLRRCAERRWPVIFLLGPAGLYFLAATASHLNIGLRHLLPVYPFLYVLAGGLALELNRWRRTTRTVVMLAIAGTLALSSRVVFFPARGLRWQAVAPHYLAYFNELAGGPANGFNELVDSNLDWGQDLKNLKLWLDARSIKDPICLCYCGMADPRYYQIAYYNMPEGYFFEPKLGFEWLRPGGLFAISATNLQGVYASPAYRLALKQILKRCRLVDVIGYSIFVYQFNGFDDKS